MAANGIAIFVSGAGLDGQWAIGEAGQVGIDAVASIGLHRCGGLDLVPVLVRNGDRHLRSGRHIAGRAGDWNFRRITGVAEVDRQRTVAWPIVIATATGSQCDTSRSEEHTSELQSLMRISYAVFCLKKKKSLYI